MWKDARAELIFPEPRASIPQRWGNRLPRVVCILSGSLHPHQLLALALRRSIRALFLAGNAGSGTPNKLKTGSFSTRVVSP